MTSQSTKRHDPDIHKGVVEGDRPTDAEQLGKPNAPGINDEGLPDNPIAMAEDSLGANEDETRG